jgi:hypothetical protein
VVMERRIEGKEGETLKSIWSQQEYRSWYKQRE